MDCRSEFVSTQAPRRVGVFPLDRASVRVLAAAYGSFCGSRMHDRTKARAVVSEVVRTLVLDVLGHKCVRRERRA